MNERHVLILGGTTEARHLAEALTGTPWRVTTSLAGRVAAPRALPGAVRVGGFGGAEGLAAWLRAHRVTALVDATHPFAATMSFHAAEAAAATGVPLLALRRPGWTRLPGDDWHDAASLDEAASLLPGLGSRVFLTTGRTGLAAFTGHPGLWFLVRAVDPPEPPLPARSEVLLDRGPFTLEGERALLARHRVDVLVTKDSGGTATAPKLTAAREAALPVIVVRRPPVPDGVPQAATPAAALAWLRALAP
ncbi:cobalt-precorrin-6A reductase [Streptomyces sp. NRRL F-5630]|uniref:cobalt-precorrin-6A reductase n=1 Tax=Streptomyces sp. NRRL F-5630 TaxID=1463864 RepID=UPI003D725B02